MKKAFILLIIMFAFVSLDAMAQGCAMCSKTASDLDTKSAKGLNGGILYLAAIPVTFLGILGYIWYKKNKATETKES